MQTSFEDRGVRATSAPERSGMTESRANSREGVRQPIGPAGEGVEDRRFYVSVTAKFVIALAAAFGWFFLSLWLAQPWLADLSGVVGPTPAFLIIFFVALVPGFFNAHMLTSVLMDFPPPLPLDRNFPPITLLIAAYNEGENLTETFRGIAAQDYPNDIEIIVVDDGSTDSTVSILHSFNVPNLRVIAAKHGGKVHALNTGLRYVSNEIMVCIDADTFLHKEALRRIVARMLSDPPNTAAVAGCVLVKNSRETFLARMQEWDYFAGIASAKRQQSLYQGTLVAQGAFSAFRTDAVRERGGWPDKIGEDIVLTWSLLKDGWRIGFEASALGFTLAPESFKAFVRQRERWARGMMEGLTRHGSIVWRGTLSGFFVGIDFIIPLIDFFYTFAFLPGVVLAFTGRFYIVGPISLLVFPLALFITLLMYRKEKLVFDQLGPKIRRNPWGFLVFLLTYQAMMSPICLIGYCHEAFGTPKRW